MANLSNQQQSNLQNLHAKQQTLLTDQAARNAALQFNATSQNQVNQFYDSLNSNIQYKILNVQMLWHSLIMLKQNKVAALNAKNATALADANAQRETAISSTTKH